MKKQISSFLFTCLLLNSCSMLFGMQRTVESKFEELPNEIFLQIFHYLEPKNLAQMKLLSRRFNELLDSQMITNINSEDFENGTFKRFLSDFHLNHKKVEKVIQEWEKKRGEYYASLVVGRSKSDIEGYCYQYCRNKRDLKDFVCGFLNKNLPKKNRENFLYDLGCSIKMLIDIHVNIAVFYPTLSKKDKNRLFCKELGRILESDKVFNRMRSSKLRLLFGFFYEYGLPLSLFCALSCDLKLIALIFLFVSTKASPYVYLGLLSISGILYAYAVEKPNWPLGKLLRKWRVLIDEEKEMEALKELLVLRQASNFAKASVDKQDETKKKNQ